jgi:mannose-6-phosphate isomerase-like protein (cupin superfamily)
MGAYTVANLKDEVENKAPAWGVDPEHMQLRAAREQLATEHLGVSYKSLGPARREPFGHRHNRQEEVYVLVSGSARMKLDHDVVELERWTAVRVSPRTMRSLEAGPDGAELIVAGAPNTGPGDGELAPGWWSE